MNVVQLAAHRKPAAKAKVSDHPAAADEWLQKLALTAEACLALQDALRVTLQTAELVKQIAERPTAHSPLYLGVVEAGLKRQLVVLHDLWQALQPDQSP